MESLKFFFMKIGFSGLKINSLGLIRDSVNLVVNIYDLGDSAQQTLNVTNSRMLIDSSSSNRSRLEKGSPSVGESSDNMLSYHKLGKQPILLEEESTLPFSMLKATFPASDFPTCPLLPPLIQFLSPLMLQTLLPLPQLPSLHLSVLSFMLPFQEKSKLSYLRGVI
ncbi:hypothetical protein J1N35_014534 [Gossypium stocksii]|uniref:Uncharacterized protein n=1 Tax=Gossypium stocksii TaxID=47602 RepID=A0A9D3VVH0_9ROSI|nr:hypothetical protein J1N35_014534 [Gossypium stocksii]